MGFSSSWQGCSWGFLSEQPCQPLENPVHPSSCNQIYPIWFQCLYYMVKGTSNAGPKKEILISYLIKFGNIK